ncbi:MAG: 7-cyano-7-deazaguanine synthase QueC [Vicinamibacteria bacterium]|nr:7-cyano-7-deazaguanine synthase QueC [Vicinamibacteria bacterium]
MSKNPTSSISAFRPLAVVCLSGGMDSALTAALALRTHDLAVLHANYGQRTERRELSSFLALADRLEVAPGRRLVVDFTSLRQIGGSSLTDLSIAVRHGEPEEGVVPSSYVPFRNAHLLAAATSWAEVIGATSIFMGAVEADSSGYPDCRPAFFQAFADAIRLGTRADTRIVIETPVIALSKAEIIQKGLLLAVPFDLTWSCYESNDQACGECESCRLRLTAFAKAGSVDPIRYRSPYSA